MHWREGFYAEPVAGSVEIDDATYRGLLDAMESGKVIVTAASGLPQAVDSASVMTLAELRNKKILELTAACAVMITGGYRSAALGAEHTYPSKMTDQINLMGSVTDSLMPDLPADWQTPFWVLAANGVWSWKMHNAVQIQQAGRDGKAHVMTCQGILAGQTDLVLSAQTPKAVNAVIWPEGGNI